MEKSAVLEEASGPMKELFWIGFYNMQSNFKIYK